MTLESMQVGDIVSLEGPVSLGGGLNVQVNHSQLWQVTAPGELRPVVIDTLTLRNGWTVKFSPRAMRESDVIA